MTDSFWSDRQRLIRETVIPYQWNALNDAIPGIEPSHTVKNFRIAAKEEDGNYYGMVFQDSDLGKWIETVGFSLAVQRDEDLEQITDGIIDLIEHAQNSDGYLNTYFTVAKPGSRWTNVRDDHELYCAGHLMEAAVAYYDATGKDKLLNVVCRMADHIGSVFGTEPGKKRGYPGHPEIELALVKLYHTTGNQSYLDLSKYFVDERGQQPAYFEQEAKEREERRERAYDPGYSQAHLPIREQSTAEGHSVRAMYLYTAVADLAALYDDEGLLAASRRVWRNVTRQRMYVTGGIGSSAYHESFTVDYDLPNDRAYTESCAAIGLVFWAYRMLQLDADREYADVMERALFNGILSGIALDGKSYFYVNPLEVWPATSDTREDMRTVKKTRQPWFGCACCPPNIARLLASLGQYIYSVNEEKREIFVHLYAGSQVSLQITGQDVTLEQTTEYPWDGHVRLGLSSVPDTEFTIALRLPAWCANPSVQVNGDVLDLSAMTSKGYAYLQRTWNVGDQIDLVLPMTVDMVRANPKVRADIGKVALQRGPIVFCLEEVDNGENLPALSLPQTAEFSVAFEADLLGGVPVITTLATRPNSEEGDDELYSVKKMSYLPTTMKAIPYFAWANRTPGEMLVWIREQ